ncbi:MAG: hypothetical protein IBX55_15470 [Methyloprofundus sp.]|nr:hypothetical protein [Methyloprofundus sp.]
MASFEDKLNKELAMRKKEVSELYLLVQAEKSENTKKYLLRALLLMIYAHWEGFVRISSQKYLQFILKEKPSCESLVPSMKAFYVHSLYIAGKRGSEWDKFLNAFNHEELLIFDVDVSDQLSTQSNLNTKVFKDIVSKIGVSDLDIDLLKGVLDDGLLASRNAIAHGEMTQLEFQDVELYKEKILDLLDLYADLLIENFNSKSYLCGPKNLSPLK